MQLSCPTAGRLRDFLEGSVGDAEADQISAHVVECPNCDLVLCSLESEQGDVLETLREGVRTESLLHEPEFEQLRNTARLGQSDTTVLSNVDEHPETGKRLRDYRLVKKIGEGGMGTVYQAFHVHLAKHVALKILPSDKLRSKQSVARFRQEMRAVGKVNHPNVVSASDAGTIEGQHFLVMELVQGADLARIIHDRGPLHVADACEIVRQAAIGLQHAHDNGLVHRDVKPSNIMLALDGSVKLLDLGLAGLNNSEFESTANVVVTERLTSVGQIMGTLDYMAPEQITASPEVDGKADIYALGATLFQLLTGRTPCGDRSEGTPQRIEAVLHKPPLDIATLRNDLPEELRALLLRMLAKKPEDRPQAAMDVANELRRFASDADLGALAEECRTSLDMPSADVDVTDDVSFVVSRAAQPQDDRRSKRPFRAIALVGFFLALVAAIVYYIQTNNGVIRVRVMDESLAVTIKGQTVEMKDGDKELRIRAGDYKLEVSHRDSDFKFLTDQFEVERNGEIAFEVDLIPGKVVVRHQRAAIKTMPLPEEMTPLPVKSTESTPKLTASDVRRLLKDASTRAEGNRLLKQLWLSDKDSHYNLLTRRPEEVWSFVSDPIFYLRSKLLPAVIAREGSGWGRFKIEGVYQQSEEPGWGYPLSLKPLLNDKAALSILAEEVEAAIAEHPHWKAGVAVLSYLEAETGNVGRATELIAQVVSDAETRPIPSDSAFIFGMALEGKNADLDRQVMRLYESSLRARPPRVFRASAIPKLARLYAKYGEPAEARRLLYRLTDVDYDPSGSTVICSPAYLPQNHSRCNACHRGKSNLLDVVVMSNNLTDVGYPVDALVSLARINASFSNAYGSGDAWAKKVFADDPQLNIARGQSRFVPAKERAEKVVTPQAVLEALKSGVFSGRDMTKPAPADADVAIELMTAVRGVDGRSTLFSPAMEVLELAAKAKGDEAAIANVQIDQLLSAAFDENPIVIEMGIAATVFAFFRNDLDSAKDRLKNLQAITGFPESDGVAFWLVARHALQYEQTKIIGAVLAERALAAAALQPDSGLKEAIASERSGIRAK